MGTLCRPTNRGARIRCDVFWWGHFLVEMMFRVVVEMNLQLRLVAVKAFAVLLKCQPGQIGLQRLLAEKAGCQGGLVRKRQENRLI